MARRAAILAMVGRLCAAVSAHATDSPVTTTSDSGTGSLREAISDSNTNAASSPNTITFMLPATPTTATITLSSDLDAVTSDTLSFIAPATPVLTINGGGKVLFQNASTAHNVTFDGDVTYSSGKFLFTEASSGTIAGTLTGRSAALTKKGTGTTISTGLIDLDTASSVSIEEGTFSVDGTLTGAGTLTVAAPATLTVAGTASAKDVTDSGTIDVASSGQLNATNSLLVASGGTLQIDTGGAVNLAAQTLTNHGTVVANGTLTAGSLVIASDGVLTGNTAGTSVNAPVTVAGRVAPSTATGRIGITGPVSFGSTSTFEVDMGPSNAGDSLAVTNAVTIAPGARLALVADPTAFAVATPSSKTVLTASSLSGQFTPTDYAFFTEDFNYQPGSLTVTLTKTAQTFAPFAQTPNQRAVAATLDAASPGAPGSDLQSVFNALYSAQANEIGPVLDAIGGESLTAFATARQILAERTGRALHRRTRDITHGEGRAFWLPPAGASEPDVSAGIAEGGEEEPPAARDRVQAGAWLDGLGMYGKLDGDTGEAEVHTLLYGGTLGADAWIAEHVLIGLAAGYARSDVDLDGRDTDVYGDTVQGALYAGYTDPRGYLSAYGRYAYTYETSHRSIETAALRRQAHAHFDAHDYGAGGEAGLTVASFGGIALQPVAGFDWLRLTEESYTESGAGSLSLTVDPKDLDTTVARFGARVFGRVSMGAQGVLLPELRAFWQAAYGDRERVLNARLSGAPGLTSIGVRGPELPRQAVILGVGWGVLLNDYLSVSFDYDSVLDADRIEHQGTVAARVLF